MYNECMYGVCNNSISMVAAVSLFPFFLVLWKFPTKILSIFKIADCCRMNELN